jgi:uncharacterized membrane protein YeaQ/YmgE (transglycosylase-associated protein family)
MAPTGNRRARHPGEEEKPVARRLLGCPQGDRTTLTLKENNMLNLLVWAVIGAVLGLIASRFARPEKRLGVFLNLLAGAVGAIGAGLLVAPHLGTPAGNEGVFAFGTLLVAVVGSLAVLLVVNVLSRDDSK